MQLFRPRPPVSADEYDWLLACFAWLERVVGNKDVRPNLILPDEPSLRSATTGPELFAAVRVLAGMEDWPCRLELVEVRGDSGDARLVDEGSGACGTFSIEEGEAVIRYSSVMLRNPDALAATFAHELCHYLLAGAGNPPGGPELIEHATDCAAAYIGFGVLLANSARQFEQWSDGEWFGWRSSTAGYLSEQSLVTAAAMFAALHGYGADDLASGLKPYLGSDARKAMKAVERDHPDLAGSLASIDLSEWA